jgi:hypothetical protein
MCSKEMYVEDIMLDADYEYEQYLKNLEKEEYELSMREAISKVEKINQILNENG